MSEKEFEFIESAPNDLDAVYEYERHNQGSSRLKAGLLMTSGFIIFGVLIGGGAFAMTGALPNILPSNPNVAAQNVNPNDSNGAATDPTSTGSAALDPSATPLDPSATPGDSNAATTASAGPTQLVVPPVFHGDDKGENESEHHTKRTATPAASPSFSGEDEGDD